MRYFIYFPFFKFVKLHFGYQTFSILKKCIRLMKLVVSLRICIQFLRACIKLDLIPLHLDKHARYSHINLYDGNFTKILDSIYKTCKNNFTSRIKRRTNIYIIVESPFTKFPKLYPTFYLRI